MHDNEISEAVIGAAIEVHKNLGPGLLESIYEEALCYELVLRGIPYERQLDVPIPYKDIHLKSPLRLDLLVVKKVIVDLKAKEKVIPIDKAQILSYLRLSKLRLGLIINFHEMRLVDGITRVVNNL